MPMPPNAPVVLTRAEVAERVFIGCFPAGISYADRKQEEHDDYKQLAFLPFDTLELQVRKGCHPAMLAYIEEHVADMQSKRGQQFTVSTCGQTVLLGGRRY